MRGNALRNHEGHRTQPSVNFNADDLRAGDAILLSQCGALAAAMKVRLFGGSSAVATALASTVGTWSMARWATISVAFALEMGIAVAAFPALYAIDVPHRVFGGWPICSVAALLGQRAR